MEEKLRKVNSDHDRMRSTAQMDENVMIGLKKKLEAAESELESLKRKRADSICGKYNLSLSDIERLN